MACRALLAPDDVMTGLTVAATHVIADRSRGDLEILLRPYMPFSWFLYLLTHRFGRQGVIQIDPLRVEDMIHSFLFFHFAFGRPSPRKGNAYYFRGA